jgi:hypothetical protein
MRHGTADVNWFFSSSRLDEEIGLRRCLPLEPLSDNEIAFPPPDWLLNPPDIRSILEKEKMELAPLTFG